MHRLFVAVDLPEAAKPAAAGIKTELPGARWVPAEQLHITLRFIGDTDDLTLRAIKDSLRQIAAPPFEAALKGIGHFPPGKHPRVLWVGIDTCTELILLQQKVERALVNVGIPPEERGFSPHITIARLKETPPRLVLALEEKEQGFATAPFTVTDFHLYSSVLTNKGAVHKREATYLLHS